MPNQYIKNLYKIALVFFVILSLFFVVKLLAEFKSYGMMGSDEANTITLSGHGEVSAVPDIANIYFTINKEGKTVKEAQDAVALVEKTSLDFLKNNNVAEKDIKTSSASFNPKYEYVYSSQTLMPCTQYGCPSRPGKNVISGYEASESITVKIRNADNVGKIMQGLGGLNVTNLNGPNFAIDDEDALKTEARKKAINNAKEKTNMGILIITHYYRILNYITPDKVHIMIDGEIVDEGEKELAEEIEKNGFDKYMNGKKIEMEAA